MRSPLLAVRLSYFSLNDLSYSSYKASEKSIAGDTQIKVKDDPNTKIFVFSPKFPSWGFSQRYSDGQLYRDWLKLSKTLSKKFIAPPNILLFPCAPIQLLNVI
jgi:hypothetical protein